MPLIKKLFTGGLDQDLEDRYLEQGDWRFALNIRAGTTDQDSVGTIENVKGNTLISFTLPGGNNKTIGWVEDPKQNRVLYMVFNSGGVHSILSYNYRVNTIATVLQSPLLAFDEDFLITGINIIESNLLTWVDRKNEASILNIQRSLAGEYPTPFKRQYLDAIPYPPECQPTALYESDTTIKTNSIKRKLYQFRYKWVDLDNQETSWSPISKAPLPLGENITPPSVYVEPTNNNVIDITVSTGDAIFGKILIAAREGNTGDFFLIKEVDKDADSVSDDTTFTFRFANDSIYSSVAVADSNKLFDSIPREPGAQTMVDGNRIVYANGKDGRDNIKINAEIQPIYNELPVIATPGTVDAQITSGGQPTGQRWNVTVIDPVPDGALYVLKLRATETIVSLGAEDVRTDVATYYYTSEPGDDLQDVLEFFADQIAADVSLNLTTIFQPFIQIAPGIGRIGVQFSAGTGKTIGINNINIEAFGSFDTIRDFKRGANHEFAFAYYDFANRSSTAQISDATTIFVDFYTETPGLEGSVDMNITINHQPPIWATHWQLLYTKNQTVQRFLQFTTNNITQPGAGENMVISLVSISELYLDKFPNSILSYDFSEGDRIRFIRDESAIFYSEYIDTEILSFDSGTNEITIASVNINATAGIFFEIYSPKPTLEDQFYFEIGECYGIRNQGTDLRSHETPGQIQVFNIPIGQTRPSQVQAGVFTLTNEGDVFFKRRTDVFLTPAQETIDATVPYLYQDPNYSDFYSSQVTNIGRPNVFDTNAQETERPATIFYSQPFVPNTNINGLGTFFDLNFEEYDRNYGAIQKLYSENKRLISFQELKVGAILVNENVLFDQTGTNNIQKSDQVLSDIIYYTGEFGIGINPESFAVYGHAKYFVDAKRGAVLRLSGDGITPISEYKMHNFFNDSFKRLIDSNRPFRLYGGYDTRFNEYVLSLQGSELIPLEGALGLVEIQATLSFNERQNRWTSFYSYIPDMMAVAGIDFISFNNGDLYLHNDNDDYNVFYGIRSTSDITVVANDEPSAVKFYKSIVVESNSRWRVPEATNQDGQKTSLIQTDFEDIEGVFWAALLRDENTPNVTNPLIEGDDMRSKELKIAFRNSDTTFVKLFSVGVQAEVSMFTNA